MKSFELEIVIKAKNQFGVPKLIEVKNHNFEVVHSEWTPGTLHVVKLPPGVYIASTKLSSGEIIKQPVDLTKGSTGVVLNLEILSPHESQEWAYTSKTLDPLADEDLFDQKYEGAWLRLWIKKGDSWEISPNPIQESSDWKSDGVSYSMKVDRELQALQIGGKNIQWKCIMIPPGRKIMCLIRPVKDQSETVHPLEVVISTTNSLAESLLSFLQSGDMDMVKSMIEKNASSLLFQKMISPTNAAIGGYVLLKVGKEDRMRNWAENLTNWIDWLPDAPIIRAWQLINQKSENISEIRSLFLEAVDRGVPIYTEGMRLLVKGLKMLYFHNKQDQEIEKAYLNIKKYWEAIDWSASTTTFNGIHPAQPNPRSRKGLPEDTSEMAFIFSVPINSILDEGNLQADTQIELNSNLDEKIRVKVSARGTLIDKQGQEYNSAYQALRANAKDKKISWIGAKDVNTNEDLDGKILQYRMGQRKNKKHKK